MDYDFRSHAPPAYDSRGSSHAHAASNHPPSLYPRVNQQSGAPNIRPSPNQPSRSSSSHGLGIKITIKPEYQLVPPPQLAPLAMDIRRSTFQFDFELERRILESEKESQNWNKITENHALKTLDPTSSLGSLSVDSLVNKYVAGGLERDAVLVATANYGDSSSKVEEFVKGYSLLREMGFASKNVAEVLVMYDNDTDKALAHFLNSGS